MTNLFLILLGKTISFLIRFLNLGNGSTWPGHIALLINKNFITDLLNVSKTKTVFIIGTNGKTTTAKFIQTILKYKGLRVLINSSGANLLNGVASTLIIQSSLGGKVDKDFAIFEIDENTFTQIAQIIKPDYVIALNLFRDQLDRYGEIDSISKRWKETLDKLDSTLILNADDPQIAFLGKNSKKTYYFGLEGKELESSVLEHASDSLLCPNCGNELNFECYFLSHLGKWKCEKCGFKRPKLNLFQFQYYPLIGTYAIYITLAAVLFSEKIGIEKKDIEAALREFVPAFGRQEKIEINGKKVQFFLSKNPTSFNESLKTIGALSPKNLLIILNDRIPDGTDVSWIWDVDFENLIKKDTTLLLSGDRVYDLALRIKYAGIDRQMYKTIENLEEAIMFGLEKTDSSNTFYILPTYSAMLDARKILTGKKIL